MVYMNRVNFYVKPYNEKILKQMDKLRGNTSKSEFILQSIQYMIDTHVKNKDILSPLDLPTLADDWSIWEMYFKNMSTKLARKSLVKVRVKKWWKKKWGMPLQVMSL